MADQAPCSGGTLLNVVAAAAVVAALVFVLFAFVVTPLGADATV